MEYSDLHNITDPPRTTEEKSIPLCDDNQNNFEMLNPKNLNRFRKDRSDAAALKDTRLPEIPPGIAYSQNHRVYKKVRCPNQVLYKCGFQ